MSSLFLILFLGALVVIFAGNSNSAAVDRTKKWLKGSKQVKEKRRAALLKKILKDPVPDSFVVDQDSPAKHNKDAHHAIFTVGMSVNFMKDIAIMFSKTARDAGFKGDIVVGVTPGSRAGFMNTLRATGCIIYSVPLYCNDAGDNDRRCSIEENNDDKVAIAMLRFYMYNWWARQYSSDTEIMITDFKDVFFQVHLSTLVLYGTLNRFADFLFFYNNRETPLITRDSSGQTLFLNSLHF